MTSELRECPCCSGTDLLGAEHEDAPVYCKGCGLRALSPAKWNTRQRTPDMDVAKAVYRRWVDANYATNVKLPEWIDLDEIEKAKWRMAVSALSRPTDEAEGLLPASPPSPMKVQVMGDTQELIERLLAFSQESAHFGYESTAPEDAMAEAADTIASLQRRNEKLREALGPLAFLTMGLDEDEGAQFTTQEVWEVVKENRFGDWIDYDDIECARQALEDTDSGN